MSPETPIRKVVIPCFGDASVVQIQESSIPPPSSGQVQIAPLFSGFSGADIQMRRGTYPMQRSAPLTPGYCLVGRVVISHQPSCGRAPKVVPGDLVACLTVYDAQATLVNLPEKYLIPVPEGLDTGVATALILDWTTAYGMVERVAKVAEEPRDWSTTAFDMVKPAAKLAKGHRVFIHGMSGAVGQALLQLCRLRGAEVYGTASARNHDALRKQGATPFVYTDKAWIASMQQLGGAHAVFDPLGFESWDESYSILSDAETSILVGYGGNLKMLSDGGDDEKSSQLSVVAPTVKLLLRNAMFWQKKRTNFFYISRDDATFAPHLCKLFDMVAKGEINVGIKRTWALDEIQEAHRTYPSGERMGSLLVKIAEDGGRDGDGMASLLKKVDEQDGEK